jgi:hypothetical protein
LRETSTGVLVVIQLLIDDIVENIGWKSQYGSVVSVSSEKVNNEVVQLMIDLAEDTKLSSSQSESYLV